MVYSKAEYSEQEIAKISLELVLSHEERRELAEYAISLWQKFAELTDNDLFNSAVR
jgi:hypothetical protein